MSVIYTLNGLSYLAVSLMAFYIYFLFCKKEDPIRKVGAILGVNGIFYLLMSLLNFLWVLRLLEPNGKDFFLVNVVLTVVSSVLILYAIYKITGNRNLVYLLVLFITVVFAVNFSIKAFFIVTLGVSYLLMSVVFLELVFFSNMYLRWAGYAGLSHSAVSILFSFLTLSGYEADKLLWFIPTSLMFIVFLFIYFDVQYLGIIKKEAAKRKRFVVLAYIGVLGKFLIFIASISAFIFVSAIAIHELGHALVAQYYGCDQFKAVIYDIIAPHTEITCDTYYNNVVLTIAGIASTLFIGLVFMLTGSQFTRSLSYLLFGFGLLVSYGDLLDLEISKNIITLVSLMSLIIVILAIIRISTYYLKEQDIFKSGIDDGIKRLNEGEPEVRKILKYDDKNSGIQNDKQPKKV